MVIAFTLFIAFLSGVLTFITSTGGLTANTTGPIHRKITAKGLLVIGIVLIVIAATAVQTYIIEHQQDKKESQAKEKQDQRDSVLAESYRKSVASIQENNNAGIVVIKRSYDSANKDLFLALAQYGLKYEATEKRIVRLISDSVRQTIIESVDPDVSFVSSGGGHMVLDSIGIEYNMRIRLVSEAATAKNAELKMQAVGVDTDGTYTYIGELPIFPKSTIFPKGAQVPFRFTITRYNVRRKKEFSLYFYLLTGSYTNTSGQKKYIVDQVYKGMIPSGVGIATANENLKVRVAIPRRG
jgi:hypothetical protein